jgi:hypothetical protein
MASTSTSQVSRRLGPNSQHGNSNSINEMGHCITVKDKREHMVQASLVFSTWSHVWRKMFSICPICTLSHIGKSYYISYRLIYNIVSWYLNLFLL